VDAIGWFIATTHELLGHEKAAAVMGVPVGDAAACVICRFERTRSSEDRQVVLALLRPA
jgi:hypothetical protein